jgi:deoxyribodipyrimidine photo-lyase
MHLVWLRNNLRVNDNRPLYDACASGGPVRVLYAVTPRQWTRHNDAPSKQAFCQAAFHDLTQTLAALGIETDVIEAPLYDDLPKAFVRYAKTHGVTDVWFEEEIPIHEARRDRAVRVALERAGVTVHLLPYPWLVDGGVQTQSGTPYKVFTPWYRATMKALKDALAKPLPAPAAQGPALNPKKHVWTEARFRDDLWPASTASAEKRLHYFITKNLHTYGQQRDYPGLDLTSRLSPYLTNGLLSLHQCVGAAWQVLLRAGSDPFMDDWIRELCWREFYGTLMAHFPRLSMGKAFKDKGVPTAWRDDPKLKRAFEAGETGFPIADAAVRQLRETGWMHNRLRMVVASFYCKLLLLPWWDGEAFFMRHLIDGDFASNNGGWQWCASTGCDASPWFRIFNPLRQSRKFDPKGEFITSMLPGFRDVDAKERHDPSPKTRKRLAYPEPIIDYKSARARALDFYGRAARGP